MLENLCRLPIWFLNYHMLKQPLKYIYVNSFCYMIHLDCCNISLVCTNNMMINLKCLHYYPRRLCSHQHGIGHSITFVCLGSKRKTAWAISTKVGRRIVHWRISARTDPEVKKSNPDPNLRVQLALKGKRHQLAAPKSVDIRIVHGRTLACTDHDVNRSKVKS